MSILEKVQKERMGVAESPHVAHAKEWAEPEAAAKPVNLAQKWRDDLDIASAAPRYGKKNGDYYEGVVNEQGMMRPGLKLGQAPVTLKEQEHHRYGEGVSDPARPREAPFAWSDDSGTVADTKQTNSTSAREQWAKNLAEAQSGPRFAKSHGNYHGAKDGNPANIHSESAASGAAAAGGKHTGEWAHARSYKPAPYLASHAEWQHTGGHESESIMGRKIEHVDYAARLEAAKPAFNFAKSHGNYHIKSDSESANPVQLCCL